MKVKVNGAWVDVPAFRIVEDNGHGVIEGEITLASQVRTFDFEIPEVPSMPYYVQFIYDGDTSAFTTNQTITCIEFFNGMGWIAFFDRGNYASFTRENLAASPFTQTRISVKSYSSNYLPVGNYKYKIAY